MHTHYTYSQKADAYATAAAAASAHQNEKKELKAHIAQLRQEVVQLKKALNGQISVQVCV